MRSQGNRLRTNPTDDQRLANGSDYDLDFQSGHARLFGVNKVIRKNEKPNNGN